jgi:hypothetical protein
MAVYKRRYNPYIGSLTPEWSRFFVLTRYAFADLFKSRFFVLLLVLSLVPNLFFAGYIFIANNKTVQLLMQLRSADFFSVESEYFIIIMIAETQAAFLLNCWVGPVLIAGDLTNGALPLFLSRPFSRAEFSGRVGVGQIANCGYGGNLHLIFCPRGPRRDVQRRHGNLLGTAAEFLVYVPAYFGKGIS